MSKPATFESREQKDLQEFVFEATLAVLLHDPRNDYEDCVSPCLSLQFHVSCTRNRTHYARKCKGHNERRCTSSWSNFHFHIASLALPTWTTLQRRRDPSPKLSSIKGDEKQRQIAHASFFHTIHTLLHWNRYNCVVSIVSVFPCFTYPCHFFRDVPIKSRQSHLKSSQTPGKMHSWRKVLRPQKVFCLTSFQGASKKSQEFLVEKKRKKTRGPTCRLSPKKNNIWLLKEKLFKIGKSRYLNGLVMGLDQCSSWHLPEELTANAPENGREKKNKVGSSLPTIHLFFSFREGFIIVHRPNLRISDSFSSGWCSTRW